MFAQTTLNFGTLIIMPPYTKNPHLIAQKKADTNLGHLGPEQVVASRTPSRGKYLRQIVHDLNNFLMVLQIRCEQLEGFVRENYEAQKQLVLVQENITMISDIVDELSDNEIVMIKDVQMSPQGFFQYLGTQIDSLRLVCREVAELRLLDTDRKTTMPVRHPDYGHIALADESKNARISFHEKLLRRVLMQLIRNVIETAPVEQIGLRQSDEQGNLPARLFVSFQLELTDTHLNLHITDTGPGIAKQHISQIFEEGFTTKAGENRGFGLLTAKNYVELWNGRLELVRSISAQDSDDSTGTHFQISSPLSYEV